MYKGAKSSKKVSRRLQDKKEPVTVLSTNIKQKSISIVKEPKLPIKQYYINFTEINLRGVLKTKVHIYVIIFFAVSHQAR